MRKSTPHRVFALGFLALFLVIALGTGRELGAKSAIEDQLADRLAQSQPEPPRSQEDLEDLMSRLLSAEQ